MKRVDRRLSIGFAALALGLGGLLVVAPAAVAEGDEPTTVVVETPTSAPPTPTLTTPEGSATDDPPAGDVQSGGAQSGDAPSGDAPSGDAPSGDDQGDPGLSDALNPVEQEQLAPSADSADLTLELSLSSAPQGSDLNVSATGFQPGEQVDVVMNSDPVLLATLTADADGAVRGAVRIPADAEVAQHTIVLTGQTSGRSISSGLTVTAGPSASTDAGTTRGASLAATGGSNLTIALVGLAMVLLGGALVGVRRARSAR